MNADDDLPPTAPGIEFQSARTASGRWLQLPRRAVLLHEAYFLNSLVVADAAIWTLERQESESLPKTICPLYNLACELVMNMAGAAQRAASIHNEDPDLRKSIRQIYQTWSGHFAPVALDMADPLSMSSFRKILSSKYDDLLESVSDMLVSALGGEIYPTKYRALSPAVRALEGDAVTRNLIVNGGVEHGVSH